jgi:hydroxypyruvate isomerase
MVFTDLPFLDRISKAAETGYDAIEFWNWGDKDLQSIVRASENSGIEVLSFQSNRGGSLINPEFRDRFVSGIKESLEKANSFGIENMFLLTDELGPDRSVIDRAPEISENAKYHSVLDGLQVVAELAEQANVVLNLEPLNTKVDHPGYWLNHVELGFELVRIVSSPYLRLLFDCYHAQIMDGNLIPNLVKNMELIGHIHVADTPGRHEPGTGEVNYGNIFKALRTAGYDRYVGMEFEPIDESVVAANGALKLLQSAEIRSVNDHS